MKKSVKMKKSLKSITLLSVRSAKKVNLRYLLFGVLISTMLVSCKEVKKVIDKISSERKKIEEVSSDDEGLSSPEITASAKELVRITDDAVAEIQPSLLKDGKHLLYVIRDNSQEGDAKWSIRLKKDILLPRFTPLIEKKRVDHIG